MSGELKIDGDELRDGAEGLRQRLLSLSAPISSQESRTLPTVVVVNSISFGSSIGRLV
jgi:hypothetical protein